MVELDLMKQEHQQIIGIDEVGRGPLAGPVVACAVGLEIHSDIEHVIRGLREFGIDDSKKVSEMKRLEIINRLGFSNKAKDQQVYVENIGNKKCSCNISMAIAEVSAQKIDQINILQASLLAMQLAYEKLLKLQNNKSENLILIDGNKIPKKLSEEKSVYALVKGDSRSVAIGLASLLAKNYRDGLMQKYHQRYPYYDFEKNAGYPTAKHRAMIQHHGISPIHRKSFKGVKEFCHEFKQGPRI